MPLLTAISALETFASNSSEILEINPELFSSLFVPRFTVNAYFFPTTLMLVTGVLQQCLQPVWGAIQ